MSQQSEPIPKDRLNYVQNTYYTYFKIFGIIPGKLSRIYPYFVCLFLWFFVLHLLFLIFTDKHQTHLYWGNITIFLQDYKLYYLLPKLLYTLQTAITATLFLINEREILRFIPVLSADELDQGNTIAKYDSQTCKEITDARINTNNIIIFLSTAITFAAYSLFSYENLNYQNFFYFIPWIVFQTLWAFYSTSIFTFTTTYFNIVCVYLGNRFKYITNSLKELAQSDPESIKGNDVFLDVDNKYSETSDTFDRLKKFWCISIILNHLCFITYCCYAFLCLFTSRSDKKILLFFNPSILFQTLCFLLLITGSITEVNKRKEDPLEAVKPLFSQQLNLRRKSSITLVRFSLMGTHGLPRGKFFGMNYDSMFKIWSYTVFAVILLGLSL